jgi:hypothetical protein
MQTADRVRQILSTRGLTLYQVSQRSAELFGRSSPYFIPQGFYHELAAGTVAPDIYRFVAISRISNYRLCDWLEVFGFRLDDIPRLQLLIPWRRTVLLDSSVYDEEQWIPWFADRGSPPDGAAMGPLRRHLKPDTPRRARDLPSLRTKRFLYVKIGRDDVFASPGLAPGSIARVERQPTEDLLPGLGPRASKNQFLVDNGLLLNCGHLSRLGERILLCSTRFPFPQRQLTLDRGSKILGVVDAEFRSLAGQPLDGSARESSWRQPKHPVPPPVPQPALQELLQTSRTRVGLSFRAASAVSEWIANTLADRRYFAAPSTLFECETLSLPIHHIQKMISLCILYCIDFWTLLRTSGLLAGPLGLDALPDEMALRTGSPRYGPSRKSVEPIRVEEQRAGFLSTLIGQWGEVPLFVRTALPAISRLKNISLSDIFWVGQSQDPLHPCLVGAVFLAVNRRIKTPSRSIASTAWDEPLYILLLRDGRYLCGSCRLNEGVLTLHPHSERSHGAIELTNGVDAEIIGQVTAIFRRLS